MARQGLTRVEIPAYTDRWMMGDRFGEIVKTYTSRKLIDGVIRRIAIVKLDKSGKTVRVILDDCRIV